MHMNEDRQQTDRALFTLFAFNANNSQTSEHVNSVYQCLRKILVD